MTQPPPQMATPFGSQEALEVRFWLMVCLHMQVLRFLQLLQDPSELLCQLVEWASITGPLAA